MTSGPTLTSHHAPPINLRVTEGSPSASVLDRPPVQLAVPFTYIYSELSRVQGGCSQGPGRPTWVGVLPGSRLLLLALGSEC